MKVMLKVASMVVMKAAL
jgi:hypothetical protein